MRRMNQKRFIIFTTILANIFAKNENDFDNWNEKEANKCTAPKEKQVKHEQGKSDLYEKYGKLSCDTSLANWLDSTKDPDALSYKNYNENDQPLDSKNPKIVIDFGYFQQAYGGIDFKGIYSMLALMMSFTNVKDYY